MLTVLVADDEPHVVDLVRVTLEDSRVRVAAAADGATALARAAALRPAVVFLDVQLPDMTGFDVCRRLRADAALARTTIVMLTGAAEPEDVAAGRAAGADDYLTKPFSPVRLLALVERRLPSVVWRG